MIWVADKEKRGTFFIKVWLVFRGNGLKEGIRKVWMDDVHPDDAFKVQKSFDDNFAEKLPFEP